MNTSVELNVRELLSMSDSPEISEEEYGKLNNIDKSILIGVLKKIVLENGNRFVRSKALNALFALDDYDFSSFLTNGFDIVDGGWKDAFIRFMSKIKGDNISDKLLSIARHDDSADLRFQAVVALGEMENILIIDALQEIAATDNGVDFEGFRISDAALDSIESILSRLESRNSID